MGSNQWFLEDKPLEDTEIELLRSLARLTLGVDLEFPQILCTGGLLPGLAALDG